MIYKVNKHLIEENMENVNTRNNINAGVITAGLGLSGGLGAKKLYDNHQAQKYYEAQQLQNKMAKEAAYRAESDAGEAAYQAERIKREAAYQAEAAEREAAAKEQREPHKQEEFEVDQLPSSKQTIYNVTNDKKTIYDLDNDKSTIYDAPDRSTIYDLDNDKHTIYDMVTNNHSSMFN